MQLKQMPSAAVCERDSFERFCLALIGIDLLTLARRSPQLAAETAYDEGLTVDVGGYVFKTSQKTLRAVEGSRLCHILLCAEPQVANIRKIFIDRDGRVST